MKYLVLFFLLTINANAGLIDAEILVQESVNDWRVTCKNGRSEFVEAADILDNAVCLRGQGGGAEASGRCVEVVKSKISESYYNERNEILEIINKCRNVSSRALRCSNFFFANMSSSYSNEKSEIFNIFDQCSDSSRPEMRCMKLLKSVVSESYMNELRELTDLRKRCSVATRSSLNCVEDVMKTTSSSSYNEVNEFFGLLKSCN